MILICLGRSLEFNLINSSIIGCVNNIAGIPTPCMQVALMLPTVRAFKKYNDDYPIMQVLVSGNVFSDRGFSLIAAPKPNSFRINSPPSPQILVVTNTQSKNILESKIAYRKPTFIICYKLDTLQKTPSISINARLIAKKSKITKYFKKMIIRIKIL